MDYFWALWLLAGIAFLILEIILKSNAAMWIFLASIGTSVFAIFNEFLWAQTIFFVVFSVALYIGLELLYKKILLKSEIKNSEKEQTE